MDIEDIVEEEIDQPAGGGEEAPAPADTSVESSAETVPAPEPVAEPAAEPAPDPQGTPEPVTQGGEAAFTGNDFASSRVNFEKAHTERGAANAESDEAQNKGERGKAGRQADKAVTEAAAKEFSRLGDPAYGREVDFGSFKSTVGDMRDFAKGGEQYYKNQIQKAKQGGASPQQMQGLQAGMQFYAQLGELIEEGKIEEAKNLIMDNPEAMEKFETFTNNNEDLSDEKSFDLENTDTHNALFTGHTLNNAKEEYQPTTFTADSGSLFNEEQATLSQSENVAGETEFSANGFGETLTKTATANFSGSTSAASEPDPLLDPSPRYVAAPDLHESFTAARDNTPESQPANEAPQQVANADLSMNRGIDIGRDFG